ncbi:hypothetical protein, partial [Streptomyces sp. 8K308]|uniref:hypothetical protein n=1 Tax=Streptomyces sp. 8K308 TaxID=2530388 RepID=UPI001A9D3E94
GQHRRRPTPPQGNTAAGQGTGRAERAGDPGLRAARPRRGPRQAHSDTAAKPPSVPLRAGRAAVAPA